MVLGLVGVEGVEVRAGTEGLEVKQEARRAVDHMVVAHVQCMAMVVGSGVKRGMTRVRVRLDHVQEAGTTTRSTTRATHMLLQPGGERILLLLRDGHQRKRHHRNQRSRKLTSSTLAMSLLLPYHHPWHRTEVRPSRLRFSHLRQPHRQRMCWRLMLTTTLTTSNPLRPQLPQQTAYQNRTTAPSHPHL